MSAPFGSGLGSPAGGGGFVGDPGKFTAQPSAPSYAGGLPLKQSSRNAPIPLMWGTRRLGINLIWGPAPSGGGGGIGGHPVVMYPPYPSPPAFVASGDCFLPAIFAACEGPIDGYEDTWLGAQYQWSKLGNPTPSPLGNFQTYDTITSVLGTSSQTPYGAIASGTTVGGAPIYAPPGFPNEALAYNYVAWFAAMYWYVGNGNNSAAGANLAFPQMQVEVRRCSVLSPNLPGKPDVFLSEVLPDFWSSTRYGPGLLLTDIDATSQSNFHNYQWAQDIRVSPLLVDGTTSGIDIINRWATIANCWIFWGGSSLYIVPLGDVHIFNATYGITYTPDLTPAFSLTLDDFLDKAQPVKVTRKDPADCYNRVRLQVADRAQGYAPSPVEWRNDTLVAQYGLRDAATIQGDDICDISVGATVVELIGKRLANIRNTYEFTLSSARYIALLPGSLVTLTEPNLGLSAQLVRVRTIEEDEGGNLRCLAEEVPSGTGTSTPQGTGQPGSGGSTGTGGITPPPGPPVLPPGGSGTTTTDWYIDPQNVTGVASDVNPGTLALPFKTYARVLQIWGTQSPILPQTVTIHFLSSHTDDSDPVIAEPFRKNGANLIVKGETLTLVATVTLSGVVAKNRATNTLLQANLGASGAADLLLENTTHLSRAWVYQSLGANNFSISQPMAKCVPAVTVTPAEVDTWANGDTVSIYRLINVCISTVSSVGLDAFGAVSLYQLRIYAPDGADGDQCNLESTEGELWLQECSSNRLVLGRGSGLSCVNAWAETGTTLELNGGGQITGGGCQTPGAIASEVSIDGDAILGAGSELTGRCSLGSVYMQDKLTLYYGRVLVSAGGSYGCALWGPGNLSLLGASHLILDSTGGVTFASAFLAAGLVSTGILLDGAALGYATGPNGPTPLLATTTSNLSTPIGQGGLGEMAFAPGGPSVTYGNRTTTFGDTTVSVTGGTVTFTAAQYNNPLVALSGTLASNATVVLPNQRGAWEFDVSGVSLNGHTLTYQSGSSVTGEVSAIPTTDTLHRIQSRGGNTITLLSGANSVTEDFVYQPGGTPGGNVYTDWTKLFAVANGLNTPITIFFDLQFVADDTTLPVGNWTFSNPLVQLFSGFTLHGLGVGPTVRLATGTTFYGRNLSIRNVTLVNAGSTTPITYTAASPPVGQDVIVLNEDGMLVSIDGAAPLIQITGNGYLSIELYDAGKIGDVYGKTTTKPPTIQCVGANSTIELDFVGACSVEPHAIETPSPGQFVMLLAVPRVPTQINVLSIPQTFPAWPNVSGGTPTVTYMTHAVGVGYNDSTLPASGSSTVQGVIDWLKTHASMVGVGTAGQILFTNTTPAAQWTSPSLDVSSSVSSVGQLKVVGLQGHSLTDPALGSANTVPVWNGSTLGWSAYATPVTWSDDLVNSVNTAQWVASISGSGGTGGSVPLLAAAFLTTTSGNPFWKIAGLTVLGSTSATVAQLNCADGLAAWTLDGGHAAAISNLTVFVGSSGMTPNTTPGTANYAIKSDASTYTRFNGINSFILDVDGNDLGVLNASAFALYNDAMVVLPWQGSATTQREVVEWAPMVGRTTGGAVATLFSFSLPTGHCCTIALDYSARVVTAGTVYTTVDDARTGRVFFSVANIAGTLTLKQSVFVAADKDSGSIVVAPTLGMSGSTVSIQTSNLSADATVVFDWTCRAVITSN